MKLLIVHVPRRVARGWRTERFEIMAVPVGVFALADFLDGRGVHARILHLGVELLRDPDFYDEYDIEILTKHEVAGVDAAGKEVKFQGDSSLKYDKLLLAPGRPRKREHDCERRRGLHQTACDRALHRHVPRAIQFTTEARRHGERHFRFLDADSG